MGLLDNIRAKVGLAAPAATAGSAKSVSDVPVVQPKKVKQVSEDTTHNSGSPKTVLTAPTYRDHLTDIFTTRQAGDARDLIQNLMKQDPDMSAATNAYLTVANREPLCLAYTPDNQIDVTAQKILNQILLSITTRYDYASYGYDHRMSLRGLAESDRWMLLARGQIASELVILDTGVVDKLMQIDPKTLEWFEPKPNFPYPQQTRKDGKKVSLDVPTVFVTSFRQDPTTFYGSSPFVSAINTIAARQQVVNDLYRIMKITGYPRMDVTVLEDVLMKNAPPQIKSDPQKQTEYVNAQIQAISGVVGNLTPDQAFIHTNSIEADMINEGKPGMALDIKPVIEVLNAQNQAGLRAMSTILGRGESGVNTASTEARLFALMADELNFVIADHWAKAFTLAVRMVTNTPVRVVVKFPPAEMRSALELEPQLLQKSQRLRLDLSDGIITDEEYAMEMYGRLPNDGAPKLSGTKFMDTSAQVAPLKDTKQPDATARDAKPAGADNAKSKQIKK